MGIMLVPKGALADECSGGRGEGKNPQRCSDLKGAGVQNRDVMWGLGVRPPGSCPCSVQKSV